ncbi:hypothetical protein SDC9_120624 [bioreactor metagenome]|uniref:Transcription regulator PadR N-terminal domain-containing protein n=1 Tax=bioreactor metagenome TaxID=1076179 RepID=A0A645C7G6_9ZZZZ
MPKKALESLTESMFYVLMALHFRNMCGTDIATYIEQHTRFRVVMGPATLYTILAKFEKEKYIREIEVEGRKRTYTLTDLGRSAYEEELLRLRQCILDAESEVDKI